MGREKRLPAVRRSTMHAFRLRQPASALVAELARALVAECFRALHVAASNCSVNSTQDDVISKFAFQLDKSKYSDNFLSKRTCFAYEFWKSDESGKRFQKFLRLL